MIIIIFTFVPHVLLAEEKNSFNNDIDATNQYIATQWRQLNRSIDMFFSNQRSKASENKSSIFAFTSFYKKEGLPIDSQYDFQLKFDLPRTTKKLKIVIEKEQDELGKAISDSSTANYRTVTKGGRVVREKKTRYTAGANLLFAKSKYFASFIHFGIRLDMPLNPFAKLDLQKDFVYKKINIELAQKFLIFRQEGFQEISQLSLNKKLSKTLQADLINSLVWSDESDIFVLRNNFILYHKLGEEKGLSYSLGANAKFSPTFYYDSYDASASYRQLLYNDWFYGTLTLGVDFPKITHFSPEKFAQIRFDIFFKE